MLSTPPVLQAPRRPRVHPCPRQSPTSLTPTPPISQPAYVLPAPVLLAVATLSLAALKRIFTKSPTNLRAITTTLRKNLVALLPRRPPQQPQQPIPIDHASRLDALRDRSLAEIDALQPFPEDYTRLAPIQRRALLQSALERAYHAPRPQPPVEDTSPPPVVQKTTAVAKERPPVATKFWNAAEQMNGRLAALGFVLCLAREVAEPGHPSLFEQVVDVVVPIAQKTPPFLVAVVDRLVDLVT